MFIAGQPNLSWKHLESDTPEELEKLIYSLSKNSLINLQFTAPVYSMNSWHTWYLSDFSFIVSDNKKKGKKK